MTFEDIHVGDKLWAALDQDDMYGADDPSDNVVQVEVTSLNAAHLDIEVRDVDSDDEFILEPGQLFPSEEAARDSNFG